jgi:hypothetical protein
MNVYADVKLIAHLPNNKPQNRKILCSCGAKVRESHHKKHIEGKIHTKKKPQHRMPTIVQEDYTLSFN